MRQSPPELTAEQRQLAMERSLEIRQARAMLKESLTIGAIHLVDAWRMETAKGMRVINLLMALPGIGHAKAEQLLHVAGIPERTTVRACGPRQTKRLFEQLFPDNYA